MSLEETRAVVEQCRRTVADAMADTSGVASSDLRESLTTSLDSMLKAQVDRLRQLRLMTDVVPEPVRHVLETSATRIDRDQMQSVVRYRARQWRDALLELLARLRNDRPEIGRHLGLPEEALVTGISEPLSDFHKNGRSVFCLTFDDDVRVIYKPRPVDPEQRFAAVVRWLGTNGSEPALATCTVLPKCHYGWASYVPRRVCRTEEDMKAFYRRQGAFLALFYLTCSSDCIAENFRVHHDHPIWVDTECLCRPCVPHTMNRDVPLWMQESILSTLMLFRGNETGDPARMHTALNAQITDDHAVVFEGDGTLRARYVDDVVRGFEQQYLWLLEHRRRWCEDQDALSKLDGLHIRVLLRSTGVYTILADWLLSLPAELKAASMHAATLALRDSRNARQWPDSFVDADLAALTRGDVPFWSTRTDSYDFFEAGGVVVHGLIERTGMSSARARADNMSEKDLENQTFLIKTFLRVRDTPATPTQTAALSM